MTVVPRVVLSAPSSGHGTGALALGLLAALADRGLDVAGAKIGPDQVDAAYLGLAGGRPGRNLDPRLVGPERVAPLFAHGAAGADFALVQGTMGLYDSVAGRPETESTAAVATTLRSPVVLVVDVAAMGQSVAALVHGFRAYDEQLWLGGVILNRVASPRHEAMLREALDDVGVPVYGALRRHELPPVLPARRLGMVPVVQRDGEALRGVRRLGEAVAATVDLDRLLGLARSAPELTVEPWSPAPAGAPPTGERPVVALAGGPGGSYSHPEVEELLRAAGAEVVIVDPLRDEALPAGTRALVVGGGFPETYGDRLSANRRLCIAVAELARTGRPVIAEGAGLLWLARELDGLPMCGVLDAIGASRDGLVIGYREATAASDSVVAPAGATMIGHKQHAAVLTPRAGERAAWNWPGGTPEGFVWRGVHASQLVPHWAAYPEIAARLVAAAGARAEAPA
ncbi:MULTISPECIES: cobyrinate a,c-diamide synthase [Micromonospora]|uniref:Cobyrinate a,c-diamide synthase n=1 Tax=Micromonospora solifontis TaxID=2487138 RepID=A0ABX9WDU4_9ACTN|nr:MULTISPECIES: cobyrinate a,c-diamide synthase [Micromonospora]NES16073.1 cobyrinate a,c-diamide synthase [Micromonospora sp. PPF5-17B]NES38607.1 cobyrinate a,c-diamide synthase [Micromonospora solifontis]NES57425.1 cobyrinate a,c-diamide synthase [Micromonospora sp. PPF5-6]RNL94488.1 cobyrinate a,c-diamide synthase [Micromonospora solifontis]